MNKLAMVDVVDAVEALMLHNTLAGRELSENEKELLVQLHDAIERAIPEIRA